MRKRISLLIVLGAISALMFMLLRPQQTSAQSPPLGPTLVTEQAGSRVQSNTKILNFVSGCTVTGSGSTANVTCSGGSGTCATGTLTCPTITTSGANLTLNTSGAGTGVVVDANGTQYMDFGVTAPGVIVIAPDIVFAGNAGAGSLQFGAMTGSMQFPTGDIQWSGASGKAFQMTSSGAGQISLTSAAKTTIRSTGSDVEIDASGVLYLGESGGTSVNIGNGADTTFSGNRAIISHTTGAFTKYNNQTAAGVGVPYIIGVGQDVASTGAGAQTTNIVSIVPGASGLFRVQVVCSVTTTDTVTTQLIFTDAVNTTSQSLTPINGVSIGGNSTASATSLIRASAVANIISRISNSSQSSTKCSSTVERLN